MSTFAERRSAGSTEAQLLALRARGFQFIDPRDQGGDVVAVVGVRAHDNVIDVVRLHSEDHAVAMRMPGGEDILRPTRIFWRQRGSANEVMSQLLTLPDDRTPGSVQVCR
jgi:hypothetical protein